MGLGGNYGDNGLVAVAILMHGYFKENSSDIVWLTRLMTVLKCVNAQKSRYFRFNATLGLMRLWMLLMLIASF